jgi:hypothetical protein
MTASLATKESRQITSFTRQQRHTSSQNHMDRDDPYVSDFARVPFQADAYTLLSASVSKGKIPPGQFSQEAR